MPLLDTIRAKKPEILAIAARCGLTDVRVFGSVARGEEGPDSDVDFLVNALEGGDPFGFVDFQEEVSKLTGRKTDILFERGVFPPLLERIRQEMQAL